MLLRAVSAATLLLLAACGAEKTAEPPAESSAVDKPKEAAPVPALEGHWQVTKIEGRGVAGSAMTASFDGGKAVLANGCIRRAWTYTQYRNVVGFKANPAGSSNCGGGTPGAEAETAYVALEQANIAIFAKDGKEASLSGTGGNLTLERR